MRTDRARRTQKTALGIACAGLLAGAAPGAAAAGAGDLDASFAPSGIPPGTTVAPGSVDNHVLSPAGDPLLVGETVITAGTVLDRMGMLSFDHHLIVRRYSLGSWDSGFAHTLDVPGFVEASAGGIVAAPNGDYLVVGYGCDEFSDGTCSGPAKLILAAVDPSSGSLDPSFGSGGVTMSDFAPPGGATFAYVRSATLQLGAIPADDRIVVVGDWYGGSASGDKLFAARFLLDGSLDPMFGSGGVTTLVSPLGRDLHPRDVVVQGGKLVIVGASTTGGPPNTFRALLLRLTADGSVDPTFGGADGPVVESTFGATDLEARGLVAQTSPGNEGRLVVLTDDRANSMDLERFSADGERETSGGFAAAQNAIHAGDQMFAGALAEAPDGKLVATGSVVSSYHSQLAVARWNADGPVDTQFGAMGLRATPVPFNGQTGSSAGTGIDVDANGRPVVLGSTEPDRPFIGSLLLARYTAAGDPAPGPSPGNGEPSETTGIASPDRPSLPPTPDTPPGLGPPSGARLLRGVDSLRDGAVDLAIACDGCSEVVGQGTISATPGAARSWRLRPARARVTNGRARLRLRIPRRAMAVLRRGLRQHARVTASVRVRGVAPDGSTSAARRFRIRMR